MRSLALLLITTSAALLACANDTQAGPPNATLALEDSTFDCTDDECRLIESQCGCFSGGVKVAVPEENIELVRLEIDISICSQGYNISQTCKAIDAACVEGKCQLVYPTED